MSRSHFGATSVDWLLKPYRLGGNTLVALQTGTTLLNFYSAQTGGTHYTDLLDSTGAAATRITVTDYQIPGFQGPDAVLAMWADKGDGSPREYMEAQDLAAAAAAVVAAEAARDVAVAATSGKVDKTSVPILASDYGLTGTTDNTGHVQAALDAGATDSRPVRFPVRPLGQPYVVTKPGGLDYMLKVVAGQKILADEGATIQVKAGTGNYRAVFTGVSTSTDLTGLTVDGLTIDHNTANNLLTDPATLFSGNPRYAIYAPAGTGITVRNCKFKNIDSANTVAIQGANVADVRIQNNTFEVTTTAALHDHSTIYTSSAGQIITGNVLKGVAGSLGAKTAIETHGSQQVVVGNTVQDYYKAMNITGVADAGNSAVIVAKNVAYKVMVGIDLWSYTGTNGGLKNCTVAHNTVIIDRDAWLGYGATAYPYGILTDPSNTVATDGLKIHGNTVTFLAFASAAITGELVAAGIQIWNSDTTIEVHDLDIFDNTVTGALSAGIRIADNIKRGKISRNRLVDCGSSTEGAMASFYKSGITVTGTQTDLTIENNATFDTRGTHLLVQGAITSVTAVTRCVQRNNTVACTDGTVLSPFVQTAGKLFVTPPDAPVAPPYRSTGYYGSIGGRSTVTTVASQCTTTPFWVPVTTAFDRIGCEVTTLAASSTVRLGIYADDGTGRPGALIVDAGTVDSSTTGAKEITIAQTLQPGLYWLAAAAQGGTPVIRSLATSTGLGGPGISTLANATANTPLVGYLMSSVSGALPDPYVQGGQSGGPGLVVLRAA